MWGGSLRHVTHDSTMSEKQKAHNQWLRGGTSQVTLMRNVETYKVMAGDDKEIGCSAQEISEKYWMIPITQNTCVRLKKENVQKEFQQYASSVSLWAYKIVDNFWFFFFLLSSYTFMLSTVNTCCLCNHKMKQRLFLSN